MPPKRLAVFLFSECDRSLVEANKWYLDSHGYVCRYLPRNGGRAQRQHFHTIVMQTPKGMEVDHRNRNKLDCRRENLRVVTHLLNKQNVDKYKNNTSGYRGVFLCKSTRRWMAMAMVAGKNFWLGRHDSAEEAHAVVSAFRKLHMPGATD